jgi:hypothetical protein
MCYYYNHDPREGHTFEMYSVFCIIGHAMAVSVYLLWALFYFMMEIFIGIFANAVSIYYHSELV